MSDYTKTTNFTAKDALSTGDPLKLIKGSYFDTEFDNIATAVATKYDSGNLASQAQAEALTLDTVLITPHTLNDVLVENAGMLGDIQALADPNADQLLGWDDSAGAVIGFTFTDGLAFGDGIVTLEHLGIEDLEDAGADRILFWDDGAGASAWLQATKGLEISGTELIVSDVSAGAAQPVVITNGTFTFDLSSITEITGVGLDQGADGFLISDAGTLKVMPYDETSVKVQAAQTTQTLALTDVNTILEFDGTSTLTIDTAANVAWPVGAAVLLVVDHASQVVTVTAAGSVTLNSRNHPGGAAAESDTVIAGGTAILFCTAADEWYLSGDITD